MDGRYEFDGKVLYGRHEHTTINVPDNGAIIKVAGPMMFWRHRVDGPAVEWSDGTKLWYVENERIYDYDEYQRVTGSSDSDIMVLRLKYGAI